MILEDTTAFVERLEVPLTDKRANKQRIRVAEARTDMLRTGAEIRLATQVLHDLEQEGRQADVETVRAHLGAKQDELARRRAELARLEQKAEELDDRKRSARMFRLHSAEHYVDCSETRFVEFLQAQRTSPVLVLREGGRRWWWYLGRFWWVDSRLSTRELRAAIDEVQLERGLHTHQQEEARAEAFETTSRRGSAEPLAAEVRLSVWRRDQGRCIDCGSTDSLRFERVTPETNGASLKPDDVELLCGMCAHLRRQPGPGSRAWDVAEV